MSRRKTATPRTTSADPAERSEKTLFLNHVLDQAATVLASNPTDARHVRYVRALPHIMTEWWARPRYLGADDRPIALKLRGRGPSLNELVQLVLPGEDPSEVAQALVDTKAIRFEGDHCIPLRRQVSFTDVPALLRAHTIGSLHGHISAIQHNVSGVDPNERALEKEAFNLHVPARLLPEVHAEIRRRGSAFLSALDDFLLETQVAPGSEPTVGVGVSMSAYQDFWTNGSDHLDAGKDRDLVAGSANPAVDPTVAESIQRFVRISRMLGVSEDDFVACVRQEYFKHAETPPPQRVDTSKEIPAASDVMTVWHDDPRYTENGKPRALVKRGRSPTFESLVRAVDASLDTEVVLKYLIRTGTVKRRGKQYIAMSDTVIVHGVEGPAVERSVRGLGLMLALTERNLTVKDVGDGLFERTAENAQVPVSKLSHVKKFIDDEGMGLLRRGNTLLRELQAQRQDGEPTVEAGFGVYRHQTENRSQGLESQVKIPRSTTSSPPNARRSRRTR